MRELISASQEPQSDDPPPDGEQLPLSKIARFRKTAFQVLDGRSERRLSRVVNFALLVLIITNVFAYALETVESFYSRFHMVFDGILAFSVGVFSIEYLLRIWSVTTHPSGRYRHPIKGRLRYTVSPLALLDLASVLPFYLFFITGLDLRLLRIFRLLWLLKVIRYLPAVATIGSVFRRQQRTLLAALVLMAITLFIASTLMYFAERDTQPESFGSIPTAMWWGMTTLTTVGYGDVVPKSTAGHVLGMVIMLLGIAMFALPTAILASAFIEELKRKDFLVTWHLVAGVPLFSKLDASEIAEIAQTLKPRTVMPNEVVFQRDEKADRMYFIVSGQVEAELVSKTNRLGRGDFFGEIGLLHEQRRTATVIARTYTELLELESADFKKLLESNPYIEKRIVSAAERRITRSPA